MGERALKLMMDVLSQPAVLIAAISLIGLLLQKKPANEIVKGTTKSFLGFIVISAGAGILVGSLEPFGKMFQAAFHVNGVVPNNEAIVAMALNEYGTATALIMFFGMLSNILIARFTRLKYIFLTGHHTLYMACLIAVILAVAGLKGPFLIGVGAVSLGLTMSLFPAMVQPFMKKITGNDKVAFGHFSSIGYAVSGLIGKAAGKGSRSTGKNPVSKRPRIFKGQLCQHCAHYDHLVRFDCLICRGGLCGARVERRYALSCLLRYSSGHICGRGVYYSFGSQTRARGDRSGF